MDIAATTRLDAHNQPPLSYCYRIADNLLEQARLYREEKNVIDLYIILLRFSSLVSKIIPQHQDYPSFVTKEKFGYLKRLREVVTELDALKPEVQTQVGLLNKNYAYQNDSQNEDYARLTSLQEGSISCDWPAQKDQVLPMYDSRKGYENTGKTSTIQNAWKAVKPSSNQLLHSNQLEGKLSKLLGQVGQTGLSRVNFGSLDFDARPLQVGGSCSLSSVNTHVHIVREPSPLPVLAYVENLPAGLDAVSHVSHFNVADSRLGPAKSSQYVMSRSMSPQYVQISSNMMEDFLKLAKSNTEKNLETCGVLAGSLKKGTFYVTTLIIPKQESTSDSCQTMNEEEIYAVQEECSLLPLGWIHTHPSQSCFMSSIDLHTQYSYQIMLLEAISIVMAPTDSSRSYGIFRLSDPGGISILKQCQQRGFHPHEEPLDGSPIYGLCSHVLMNPNLEYNAIDLRWL